MEEYFENTEVFMMEAKEEAQISMAQRFVTETEPSGDRWASLKDPSPFQQGILQLSGQMRDDSLDDDSWIATPVGVFFDTSKIPEYWIYHEQPRYDIERDSPQRIPQRKFIGLDDLTEQKIVNRGEEWLAGGIMLGGRFQQERRNMIGQFTSFT